MPITVTCHECGGAFDAPDEDADGLAPCPACGVACVVPVPGALPPLRAEAVEPDEAPRAEVPAREALPRRTWYSFARACAWLRVVAVLDFGCYLVAVGVYVYCSAAGPNPALWPVAALLCALSVAAVCGALARTLLFGASDRGGAGALFAVGALLAWGRAVLLACTAGPVLGALADGRADAELFLRAGTVHGCSTLLALLVEVSALPGFVAAGAVLPSAEVRAWALRASVAVQLLFAALVGASIGESLVGLFSQFPPVERGSLLAGALGFTFALQAVYTFLQYNLYDAGERAGRGGGE